MDVILRLNCGAEDARSGGEVDGNILFYFFNSFYGDSRRDDEIDSYYYY